jgi:mercuric reductase
MVQNQRRAELAITGMTCDSCAHHVTKALHGAGAQAVEVDWRGGVAWFGWPAGVSEDSLRDAVLDAGYQPDTVELAQTPIPVAPIRSVDYDLLVLGSGSAAFAAAIKARDAGRSVALVENGTLGGSCVNIGCVPSKALLRAGEAAWQSGHHPFTGVTTESPDVDLAALVEAKDELVAELRQAKYADLVDEYGFDVLPGTARFVDPDTVEVGDRKLRAAAVLVATGATPAAPPIPGLAEAGYLTSTAALELKEIPRRLAVIGANAIGLELGQFFGHVGSQVTFVDVAERIAPFEEPEASQAFTEALIAQGATVHTDAQVRQVVREGDIFTISLTHGGTPAVVEADELLVATGRRPNTDGLNLEAAGITATDRGAIVVDEQLRTSNPRVWAAGDVTDAPQFVYVSAYQGALAAENALLGANRTVDLTGLPRVTFTAPQIAGAGLTEAAARDAGYDVITTVLPLSAVPRALVNRDTHGVIKLVADAATNRLLGATIVADAAGEAIQTAVLAIRAGMTTDELAATFHPYLTMAEGLKLAAQTFGRDVHKLSCCAA